MAVKEASAVRPSARERLLAAANELFYNEGVHTVGIDRIIEQAVPGGWGLSGHANTNEELVAAARKQIAELQARASGAAT